MARRDPARGLGLTAAIDGRTSGRKALDAVETHEVWQMTVVAYARMHGWETWHTRNSIGSDPGWPDLFCCHPASGRRLALELKTERSPNVTPAQYVTLMTLRAVDIPAYVAYPADWEAVMALLGPDLGAVRGDMLEVRA